ncbi:MAG: NifB/NifX family molybdenum-iron cluster-binding protein [Candidatus Diapherotrites archaeon]|nr:NifB/NifX family molybdenum-iron cluster-binding protein [Candidatus Diapherotrites archaeon]
MRIAVASSGPGLNAEASPMFGRCPFFVIVNIEENNIKEVKSIPNTATAYRGGAGISAAELVGNENVDAVIAGAIGPRAFDVLKQLGIKQYIGVPGTVEKNIDLLLKGELKMVGSPTGPMRMPPGRRGRRGGQ